jgi:hypothetical protein
VLGGKTTRKEIVAGWEDQRSCISLGRICGCEASHGAKSLLQLHEYDIQRSGLQEIKVVHRQSRKQNPLSKDWLFESNAV